MLLSATLLWSAGADEPSDSPKPVRHPLDVRVMEGDWGKAVQEDVRRVLMSAAGALWTHFPDRKLSPILVEPKGGPIVLFRRGPNGEYYVKLNTGDYFWAQYSYQFAHEFCHIVSNHDDDPTGQKWFEETLCEVASLYVLRRMGETWKVDPPYENWRSFAPALTEYAAERMKQHALPDGQSLATWYREHAEALGRTSTNRTLNSIAATALLPLFEKSPDHWLAVQWLNAGKPSEPQSFAAFLGDWHRHVPAEHRSFVKRIAHAFDVRIDMPDP